MAGDRDRSRVALITGSAGGIGSATVSLFKQQGWRVVGVDRRGGSLADVSFEADASSALDLDRVFRQVDATYGGLDALVNNAAEQLCAAVVDTREEDWDRIMATNVRSAYLTAVRGFPLLKATRGSIVNVSSIHALATSVGMAAYATSKGALVALTRSLALEFAEAGVRVNAVLPGATNTPMLAASLRRGAVFSGGLDRSPMEMLASRHPLRRVAEPEEIARSIYFLADSVWSSFVTGATLVVDGGAYARLSTE